MFHTFCELPHLALNAFMNRVYQSIKLDSGQGKCVVVNYMFLYNIKKLAEIWVLDLKSQKIN